MNRPSENTTSEYAAAYTDTAQKAEFFTVVDERGFEVRFRAYAPTKAFFEKTWIPTIAGKAWFPYFRLYGPTEAHFDRKWILRDIER